MARCPGIYRKDGTVFCLSFNPTLTLILTTEKKKMKLGDMVPLTRRREALFNRQWGSTQKGGDQTYIETFEKVASRYGRSTRPKLEPEALCFVRRFQCKVPISGNSTKHPLQRVCLDFVLCTKSRSK